ncbi:MAG TPA: response regulator [Chroococcales cyanobacterium]|jgi:two-component system chemotaxis response regulator CheY
MQAVAKILIVDDALFLRMVLRDMLLKAGYHVAGEASDGIQACELYPEVQPDVVFLDLYMPNIDGITTLKKLLEIDPHARVIACSSNGKEEIIKASMLQGARDFLTKPLDETKVMNTLRKVLKTKPGTPRSVIEELLSWYDVEELLLKAGMASFEEIKSARKAIKDGRFKTLPAALQDGGIDEEDLHSIMEDLHRDVSVAVILLQAQAITMEQLRCALVTLRTSGRRLGFTLVEQGFCTQAQIADFLKNVPPYKRADFI